MKMYPKSTPPSLLTSELAAAAEPPNLHVSQHSHKYMRRGRTSGDDIVQNQDLLSLLDGICLYLEVIFPILLFITGNFCRTGQLAWLSDRNKTRTKSKG